MLTSTSQATPTFPFPLDEATRIVERRTSFEQRSDRDEVLSESLFRFWRALRESRKIERPRAYFRRIVNHVAVDVLRARVRHSASPVSDELPAPKAPDPAAELLRECARHLDRLSTDIIRLTVFDGLTAAEAAGELGCHVVTLRRKRREALLRLSLCGFVSELRAVYRWNPQGDSQLARANTATR